MFRLFALFSCAIAFACTFVFAQEVPNTVNIKVTPEMKSLIDESLQSLSQVERNPRISGLFRLLSFAVTFDDKAPAQKIVDVILELALSVEPEELRFQLYKGIARAYSDLEKYPESAAILNRISDPVIRNEAQLEIAVGITIEQTQNSELKPFDTSELLRQAAVGAAELKNHFFVALAHAYLGHELARQGKQNESNGAFAEALGLIDRLEETDERMRIFELILHGKIQYEQVPDAIKIWQTVVDPAVKPHLTQVLVSELIQREKYAEADTVIGTLPADDIRDGLLGDFVMANIKTITDVKVGELIALVSSDDMKERFLQVIAGQLQKSGRGEVALQVSKRLKDPIVAEMSLFVGKVQSLVEEKKFDEAIQLIDSAEENEEFRQHLRRQVWMEQFQETYAESVAVQIEATFTSHEKIVVAELREEAKRTTAVSELLEIVPEQVRFADFIGARQTLTLIFEQLDKETEPIKFIQERLILAQLQIALHDKEGTRANLEKLMQALSSVKNLSDLKDMVQMPDSEPPLDEAAIRNMLFQIYFLTASQLAKVDAPTESRAAFAKAKELVLVEPVASAKAEKLLLLARFLAE